MDARSIGAWAEQMAHEYLCARGLEPVARNFRCRRGELDLVMYDDGVLVFVEVRFRRHRSFGGALESVDARKQSRLIAAAQTYLCRLPSPEPPPCRFDVVEVSGSPTGPRLHWVRNAFDS